MYDYLEFHISINNKYQYIAKTSLDLIQKLKFHFLIYQIKLRHTRN